MTKKELLYDIESAKSSIRNVECLYKAIYDAVYDYINATDNWELGELFDDYADHDRIEEMITEQMETGGFERVYFLLDENNKVIGMECIKYELGDSDYTPDEAMDAVMEAVQDYESSTEDTRIRQVATKFYTADQIKEQVSALLKTQDKPSKDTLEEIKNILLYTKFSKYWYLKKDNYYERAAA